MGDGHMQQQMQQISVMGQQQMQQQVMQQMGIAPQIAQQVFHVAGPSGQIVPMMQVPTAMMMQNMTYGPTRGNGRANQNSDIPLQMIHPYGQQAAAM